jgi:hypothetical protein
MNLTNIKLPSNRKFGFFFTIIFSILGVYFFNNKLILSSYMLFSLALLFFIIALVKADILLAPNKLWMKFGLFLGMIISPIVLGIFFFGLLTPISLLIKIFGRDELRLKLVSKTSHWKECNIKKLQLHSLKQQF